MPLLPLGLEFGRGEITPGSSAGANQRSLMWRCGELVLISINAESRRVKGDLPLPGRFSTLAETTHPSREERERGTGTEGCT